MTNPSCTLYYWPCPGRGIFVRALFAFTGTPFLEASASEITRVKDLPPAEQPIPLRAPPFLVDADPDGSGGGRPFAVSQLPAVSEYVASKVGLLPEGDVRTRCLALKVLCDANDVLGELWLHNGDVTKDGQWVMWDQEAYDKYRAGRFVGWMRQWEATAQRFGCTAESGFLLGTDRATLADLSTWALWATMARCIPQLSRPLHAHMPAVMGLCARLERENAGLAALSRKDAEAWGQLYCGGMIEKSIREVVQRSVDGGPSDSA